MGMPKPGDKAPAFSLDNQDGERVALKDFAGKRVVLYFYPKDDTPGCTREACAFRDGMGELTAAGAVVLGVSADSAERHQRFIEKYDLNFSLLVDADHAVAERYGAWGEKTMYGKKVTGLIRSTFLIGPDGRIERVWPKVKVDGHCDQVLEALRSFDSPA